MDFEAPDLRQDPRASCYVKDETVRVEFARGPGSLASREGLNHYRAADALIVGSGGDRWSVTRDRFDARYQAVPPLQHGADGAYRSRPLPVLARQIPESFTVRRSLAGDRLQGSAGDWLLQYAAGDYNCLHQDLYGDEVFPLQLTVLLSAPQTDFRGGEFVVTEQRPRAQSRVEVVALRQGDAVIFAARHRPGQGARGVHRLTMRHGVSRVRDGERFTLGIVFHDAA